MREPCQPMRQRQRDVRRGWIAERLGVVAIEAGQQLQRGNAGRAHALWHDVLPGGDSASETIRAVAKIAARHWAEDHELAARHALGMKAEIAKPRLLGESPGHARAWRVGGHLSQGCDRFAFFCQCPAVGGAPFPFHAEAAQQAVYGERAGRHWFSIGE